MRSQRKTRHNFGGAVVLILSLIAIRTSSAQDNDLVWFPKGTLTSAGNFVKYLRTSKDTYKIAWGNRHLLRTLSMYMDGAPNHFAHYKDESSSVIILERGCGMPCWYAVILPLDSAKPSFEIEMPEAYDMRNNLIAYNGYQDTIVWIENFHTRQRVPILGNNCGSACNIYCVDSISVNNRELYLHYLTEYDFDKSDDQKHWATIQKHIDF